MRAHLDDASLADIFLAGSFAVEGEVKTTSGAASLESVLTVPDGGGSATLTLADGADGQIKMFVNIGLGELTVQPANFAGDSDKLILQNEGVWLQFLAGIWMIIMGGRSAPTSETIDTPLKRRMAAGGRPLKGTRIIPDESFDELWRRQAAGRFMPS